MRAKGKRQPAGGGDEVLPFQARTTFRQGFSLRQQPPPMRKVKGPVDWELDPSASFGAWIRAERSQTALYHDAGALAYEGRSTA